MKPTLLLITALAISACSVPEPKAANQDSHLQPASSLFLTIQDREVTELSGLAASRRTPGILWVHNDSGDLPRLFAIDSSGATVAHLKIDGAQAVDWEDVAIGPGPDGRSSLFIGDVGDNMKLRPEVTIYRALEPLLVGKPSPTPEERSVPAEGFDLSYPDSKHNCEALIRDPWSTRIYLLTREDDGPPLIFSADAFAPAGSKNVLEPLGKVQLGPVKSTPTDLGVTGATISQDGIRIAVRTSAMVAEWVRERGEAVHTALARPPARVVMLPDGMSEALAYSLDASILVSREGPNPPVTRIEPFAIVGR